MEGYEVFNDVLVHLFQNIMDIEEDALLTEEFKGISINDMHIIEAIGIEEAKNMSTVAKALSITVGTLTIAMNSLVKKGYVHRVRSVQDKRVVLLSLTEKGQRAYDFHMDFHKKMIQATLKGMSAEEIKVMEKALYNLKDFFDNYRK